MATATGAIYDGLERVAFCRSLEDRVVIGSWLEPDVLDAEILGLGEDFKSREGVDDDGERCVLGVLEGRDVVDGGVFFSADGDGGVFVVHGGDVEAVVKVPLEDCVEG